MDLLEIEDAPVSIGHEAGRHVAQLLNSDCFCTSTDDAALRHAISAEANQPGLVELLRERCPYVFAARPVFVSAGHLRRMAEVVRAVESVVALPGYREEVLGRATPIARHDPQGARSVFFGYDFHLADDQLGLIEINTNAGGAMLNALLARAQRACCTPVEPLMPPAGAVRAFEDAIVAMFRSEWHASGRTRPLRRIAIVDDAPREQYLYPEFLLFQRLFERHGIEAVIADPSALAWRGGRLWHGEEPIDLVYNRLTDFALESGGNAPLREAYLAGAIVLTPHPQAHALYADKQNLALLTDTARLAALGVPPDTQEILLSHIPRTEVVTPQAAERLWSERRQLFFKPTAGFGSRAAYRGDKLTRRVWQEILDGRYVAQALRAPGQRSIGPDGPDQVLKFDLRSYVYDGAVQWTAARLYQGQTTNFRTPGGGFAPVYSTGALGAG